MACAFPKMIYLHKVVPLDDLFLSSFFLLLRALLPLREDARKLITLRINAEAQAWHFNW